MNCTSQEFCCRDTRNRNPAYLHLPQHVKRKLYHFTKMGSLLTVKKKKVKIKRGLMFVTSIFLHNLGLVFITIANPISFWGQFINDCTISADLCLPSPSALYTVSIVESVSDKVWFKRSEKDTVLSFETSLNLSNLSIKPIYQNYLSNLRYVYIGKIDYTLKGHISWLQAK